jgi:flagellar basal-body rod protein FlgB
MDEITLFDQTIQTAERALNLRARRHDMITSNIANADTPGYKAFDLMVEDAMRQTADSGETGFHMLRTDPAHINGRFSDMSELRSHIVELSAENDLRGDGNTVDMEREMSNLSANQLLYKATAQIMKRKFDDLRKVIQTEKG